MIKKHNNNIIIGDSINIINKNPEDYKVDLIMIDPPYNESKSKGRYQDQWKGISYIFNWAGDHGLYLDYLYSRIAIGREYLKDEGCMMLFIGDAEYHRIRILMENIFGEENYIGTITWDSSSNQQKTKKINRNHEYVIVFCKNIKSFTGLYKMEKGSHKDILQGLVHEMDDLSFNEASLNHLTNVLNYSKKLMKENNKSYKDICKYKYLLPDSRKIFRGSDLSDPRSGNYIAMIHPKTKKECKMPIKGFSVSKQYIEALNKIEKYYDLIDGKFLKILKNKNSSAMEGVIFGINEDSVPQQARIHKEELNKIVLATSGFNYKTEDKKIGISSDNPFNTVKPINFLKELILNYPNKNAVIMDYFGGSGTTAIAVEMANKEDAGKRNWIIIEIDAQTVNKIMLPRLEYFGIKGFNLKCEK